MTIRAVVLDIGGVLIRTEDQSGREKLNENYGLPEGGLEALVFGSQAASDSSIGLVGTDRIWQNVANTLSLSENELDELIEGFWSGDKLDLELVKFLKELRPTVTTAFLSNAWKDMRTSLAEKYAITEGLTVDHILISAELGVAKPDKEIYRILAQTLNYEYDDILFVDDFPENIAAAKSLGIHTIHYQPGMNLIGLIKSELN